jgi:hypothetical protein
MALPHFLGIGMDYTAPLPMPQEADSSAYQPFRPFAKRFFLFHVERYVGDFSLVMVIKGDANQ